MHFFWIPGGIIWKSLHTFEHLPAKDGSNNGGAKTSMSKIFSVISGQGSFIPARVVTNDDFLLTSFLESDGTPVDKSNEYIIEKFKQITTISERRYSESNIAASDMATVAARKALESAGLSGEDMDYVIVAHNFGDVRGPFHQSDAVPSLAARVKSTLNISNPNCVAYDIIFGCPGWLQALIQADYFLRSGDAKHALVIGTETLSAVCDPFDRDQMIYADGAGAVVLTATESDTPIGITCHGTRSDAVSYSKLLTMDRSFSSAETNNGSLYIKMNGRRLYQYALEHVPLAMKAVLDKAGLHVKDVKKVLIHQANGKMDEAILERFYQLYGETVKADDVMPMSISWLGNSSVATLPTLYDLVKSGEMPEHKIDKGDIVLFASVGAGMNINAAVYIE